METHETMGDQKLEIITSMNQHYYELIGRDSLQSRLQYWPDHLHMTCYVEDFDIPADPRVKQIPFSELDPDFFQLQQDSVSTNAKKFAKKAYPVIHALYHSTADWLLWIDSDVLTIKPVPDNFWQQQLDSRYLAAYMGVHYDSAKDGRRGDWLVPETGVFAVNLRHAKTAEFRDEYRRRYIQRDYKNLRRFYDNDVFGAAICGTSAPYLDWCAHFTKPYKTPIGRTVLGEYLHHYKAKHSKQSYAEEVQ
jgi:hypothetical protein